MLLRSMPMKKRRTATKITIVALSVLILIHVAIAINLLRDGFHLRILYNPRDWSYGQTWIDGVIKNHRRHYEYGRTYGFLYFYKGGTFTYP